jgi:hypothetical protein
VSISCFGVVSGDPQWMVVKRGGLNRVGTEWASGVENHGSSMTRTVAITLPGYAGLCHVGMDIADALSVANPIRCGHLTRDGLPPSHRWSCTPFLAAFCSGHRAAPSSSLNILRAWASRYVKNVKYTAVRD